MEVATLESRKSERVLILPNKFLRLKKLVEEKKLERAKHVLLVTEKYIAGLNNFFYDREISQDILKEIDLPMFINELEAEGSLKPLARHQYVNLMLDVYFTARHTWQLTGSDGKVKTGDDLHRVWPLFFRDDRAYTVERLCEDAKFM